MTTKAFIVYVNDQFEIQKDVALRNVLSADNVLASFKAQSPELDVTLRAYVANSCTEAAFIIEQDATFLLDPFLISGKLWLDTGDC